MVLQCVSEKKLAFFVAIAKICSLAFHNLISEKLLSTLRTSLDISIATVTLPKSK